MRAGHRPGSLGRGSLGRGRWIGAAWATACRGGPRPDGPTPRGGPGVDYPTPPNLVSRMNPRRPLRVVPLPLGLDVGGQEKLLVEFARHRDPARVRLHIVSLTTRGALAGDIEAAGVPVTA